MSFTAAPPDRAACRAGTALDPHTFAGVRRRTVFEYHKWDVQYEDVSTLASFPIVLSRQTWQELSTAATALARETLAVEAELLRRPDVLARLGLPRAIRRALARPADHAPAPGFARLIRFDFHLTPHGWRISEANTDVPGGFNEASGFTGLMAAHYPELETPGDPVGEYANALRAGTGAGARIALVHATAYSDDHQVMRYLAQRLQARGLTPVLVSPAHIAWDFGRAVIAAAWAAGPIEALVRFFPAEWLPNLGRAAGWQRFYRGSGTPASNPATALLTQTKRLPLVWDELDTPLPTWRRLLPETRQPDGVPSRSEDWVFKPALGRVGDGIGLAGVSTTKDWKRIRRALFWHRGAWVAQRRFTALPVSTVEGLRYVCIGVYTIDDRVVGAYGRLAPVPLIDSHAQDVAILIEREP
jgi:glutathionylspermidine synthase